MNKIAAASPSPAAPIIPKLSTPPPEEPVLAETPNRPTKPAKPASGSLFGDKSDKIVPNVNPFAAAAKPAGVPVVNPFASTGSSAGAFGSTQKTGSSFKFNTEEVASEEEEESGSGMVK